MRSQRNTITRGGTGLALALCLGLAMGCGAGDPDGSDSDLIPQSFAVSECGGFGDSRLGGGAQAPSTYCDAEVLAWSYDSSAARLTLSNERVLLNCCGDHTVKLTEEQGVYVMTETDAPEMTSVGPSRCHCMCVFDMEVSAEPIASGVIDIELRRHVTDSGDGVQTVHRGKLDLSSGSGELVISTRDAGLWCGNR